MINCFQIQQEQKEESTTMSEQSPQVHDNGNHINETNRERLMAAIRTTVDAEVKSEPNERWAGIDCDNFGLEKGKYTVYEDAAGRFGGVRKFVESETGDILHGAIFHSYGGSISNPDRTLTFELLHPDGTITQRIHAEGGSGTSRIELTDAPDKSENYDRILEIFQHRMDKMVNPPEPDVPHFRSHDRRDLQPKRKESRIRKFARGVFGSS